MLFRALNTHMQRYTALLLTIVGILALPAAAAVAQDTPTDETVAELSEKSLEDLLNIEVTTVSKRGQSLADSPAAIYVITQEDIRRSGATSIPEALRMVPGMQVERVNSSKWAIGARGFCDVFSNKLLVLMDGRSVYSPLCSGVIWDVQDTMLEDIDRIEVVRGPGATLWGANAVNGVVNIVTKDAGNTSDTIAMLSFGNEQSQTKGIRVGGTVDDKTNYRIYAKGLAYAGLPNADGFESNDQWDQQRAGFRIDSTPSDKDSFTLQGDTYTETAGLDYSKGINEPPFSQIYHSKTSASGWNALARWSREHSSKSKSTLQLYYDRAKRNDPFLYSEDRITMDLDYQQEIYPDNRTALVWGLGYRHSISETTDGQTMFLGYDKTIDNLYSAFIQHDRAIIGDKVRLVLGSKLEHNDYSDYEFQPSARALWTPNDKTTFWGSISKAVRTPSIADYNSVYAATAPPDALGKPRVILISSNPNMKSEKLTAYELGHRIRPTASLSFDVAAFWNFYEDLRSLEPSAPFIHIDNYGEHRHTPFVVRNNFRGNSRGIEISSDWMITRQWRIKAASSAMNLWLDRSQSYDLTSGNMESTYPKKTYSIVSYWDIPGDTEFDVALYRVSGYETPVLVQAASAIPSYTRLDLRLAFKGKDNSEWSLGLQNALGGKHLEAGSVYGEQPTYIGRNYYLKTTRRF